MEKLLLIDGNSMVFRAFYATFHQPFTSKTGQPTNAVFGFSNMLMKALELIEPKYTVVAFDTGAKTLRHEAFKEYKGTRKALPEELISQFPLVREFIDHIPLVRCELDGYEADDLIGTLVKRHPDKEIIILTSDRDLLQLINETTTVLLMKKGITEMEQVNLDVLKQEYNLTPSQVIELKGLMGDTADNIPGIKGVGEKTAMKILDQYGTIENLYQHTDELKGKLKERIIDGQEVAFLSKQLATIETNVDFDIDLSKTVFNLDQDLLARFYRKYDMNSLLKKVERKTVHEPTKQLETFNKQLLQDNMVIMPVVKSGNGYGVEVDALLIGNQSHVMSISYEEISDNKDFNDYIEGPLHKKLIDGKNFYHVMYELNIKPQNITDDLLVCGFLVDSHLTTLDKMKDAYQLWGDSENHLEQLTFLIQESAKLFDKLRQQLQHFGLEELYENVELPLVGVLAQMEREGISVDRKALQDISITTQKIVDEQTDKIYTLADKEFNINSPKQMAEVLFDDLKLPTGKKRSTAVNVLEGLLDKHPIVSEILTYRKYQKFLSTYADGLQKYITEDNKIHTVFNQTTAQTGRLASNDPNLQNISVRDEETRQVRKVFIAPEGYHFLSVDYSQIELRVLAHMANEPTMINAFNHEHDIHTETAMKVFEVDRDDVSDLMRRQAKAVNFGIIYGMSDFGLAKQLGIAPKQASQFISNYYQSFSHIEAYMNEVITQCEANQYVSTMFNRRRYLPEISDRNHARREAAKRAAMNAPIQGTAADLIKMAMIGVSEQLAKMETKSRLILQIHDELLLLVPDNEKEHIATVVSDIMTHVHPLSVPLAVSISFGKNWYEAK